MADDKNSKVNKMKDLFEQKLSMKSSSSQRPSRNFTVRSQFPPTVDLEQEDDADISMMYIQKRSLVRNRLDNFKDEMTNTPVKPQRRAEVVVPIKESEEEDEDDDDLVSMAYIKKKNLVSDRRGQFEKSDSSIIEEEDEEEPTQSKNDSFVSNMKLEDSILLNKKRLSNTSKKAPTLQLKKEDKLGKITSFEEIDVSLSEDYTISGLLSPSPDVTQKQFNLKPIVEMEPRMEPTKKPPVPVARKTIKTEIEPPKIAPRNITKESDDSDNEEFVSMNSVATGQLSTNYEDYSSIACFSEDRK